MTGLETGDGSTSGVSHGDGLNHGVNTKRSDLSHPWFLREFVDDLVGWFDWLFIDDLMQLAPRALIKCQLVGHGSGWLVMAVHRWLSMVIQTDGRHRLIADE